MSKNELIDFYLVNGDLFQQNNVVISALRTFGFWILKLLTTIADACQQLYDITFRLVDFTTWPKINTLIEEFKPVFVALMAISIFALGIMLIANHEKKPKIAINICIACLCVTCSAVVFQQLNTAVLDAKTGIDSVTEDTAAGNVYDIIGNNMMDVYYLDQQIGLSNINYEENENKLPHPKMTSQRMNVMDYAEVMDPDSDNYDFNDDAAEDILTQMIITGGDGSSYDIGEIYDGVAWTSVGNNFYYRYKIDCLPVILELLSIIVLYIAMAYKCTRLAFELVFARLLAYLYSAELSGGQKIAKILVFIRDTYILLFVTTLCIKLFYFFTAYIDELAMNSLLEAAIILFIAFSVIDGPNLVEKLLGMDAGLKSSTARMMAVYKAGSGAAHRAMHTAAAPARMAARYGMQRYMMNRQATATSEAVRNAMDGDRGAAGFMDSEHGQEDNTDGKSAVAGDPQSHGNQNDYTGQERSETGYDAGNQRNAEQNFSDTSFMDAGTAEDAASGENDRDQSQHSAENRGTYDAAFMDNSADEGEPIGDTSVDTPDEGKQQGTFMENSGQDRNRPDTAAENQGKRMSDTVAKEKPDAHSKKRKPDRFDQMMEQGSTVQKHQSSSLDQNRIVSRYKGRIFDRNIKDGNIRKDDDK